MSVLSLPMFMFSQMLYIFAKTIGDDVDGGGDDDGDGGGDDDILHFYGAMQS